MSELIISSFFDDNKDNPQDSNVITIDNEYDVVDPNSYDKVSFRAKVLTVEQEMKKAIEEGKVKSTLEDCLLTHHFTPKDDEYGCHTYAREMFIPKDTIIIGKIHRHQHLNFIMKGQVSVATEFGKKYFTAPCIFVSEVGLKRAVYAEEDTIWVTVHLTGHTGEENLSKIEEEVIAPSYDAMCLLYNLNDMKQLKTEGENV